MEDIFKSKDDMQREEKINKLFKSSRDFEREMPEIAPAEKGLSAEKEEKKGSGILGKILLVLIFLGLLGATGYFYWQYREAVSVAKNASDEVASIAEKVKNLDGFLEEEPALATITDPEKIIAQPFFAKASAGDKALFYIQSKKIVLYRPSSGEVIGTDNLFFGSGPETEAQERCNDRSAEAPQDQLKKIATKVKVDVLNGTEIKGLAKETADKLSKIENVELVKIGNTQKSTYTKILVVDLSGKNESAAGIIAGILGGEIGPLPEGETKGTADILIIAGK